MSKEQRKHPRIDGDIEASILINGETNAVAQVRDVSAGGIAFHYGDPVALGDQIIARLDGGARLEGDVVRLFDGGFAIALEMSEHKRQRLTETIDRARARGRALDKLNLERRLAARVAGMRQSVVCETADRRIPVRIIDMSLTGVAIETDERLEMDSMVVIGKMRGTVARIEGNRYGIQFLTAEEGYDALGQGLAAAETLAESAPKAVPQIEKAPDAKKRRSLRRQAQS